jgi:hypothetical protein
VVANERDLHQVEENETEEDAVDEIIDELDDELVDLDALDDEDEDLDDEDDESADEEKDDEEEADLTVVSDSDSEPTSLEALLDQRSAARRGTDDADEDEDFSDLSSEATRAETRAKSKVAPLRNREEFVCKRCFLLKPKVQLADPERMLCRDCV